MTEDELWNLFEKRGDGPQAATAAQLAAQFKIKDSEVKALLKYLSPVVPIA
jgi:hypothetical protein